MADRVPPLRRDVKFDPNLRNNPKFRKATTCLLVTNPDCIPLVRNQERTYMCWGFGATTVMFGDEVANRDKKSSHMGKSIHMGSVQELMDYTFRFIRPPNARPSFAGDSRSFDIPLKGFPGSLPLAFEYVKRFGLTPEAIYSFAGRSSFDRYIPHADGWDGVVKIENRKIKEKILKDKPMLPTRPVVQPLLDLKTKPKLNVSHHIITLIGFGQKGKDKYYIFKNSYGLNWGYSGYGRILRDLVLDFYVPMSTSSPTDTSGSTSRKKRKRKVAD